LFLLVHTEKAGGTLPPESANLGLSDSRQKDDLKIPDFLAKDEVFEPEATSLEKKDAKHTLPLQLAAEKSVDNKQKLQKQKQTMSLRNIKAGSNCIINVLYTIYSRGRILSHLKPWVLADTLGLP
jgi:hypothetical protein